MILQSLVKTNLRCYKDLRFGLGGGSGDVFQTSGVLFNGDRSAGKALKGRLSAGKGG